MPKMILSPANPNRDYLNGCTARSAIVILLAVIVLLVSGSGSFAQGPGEDPGAGSQATRELSERHFLPFIGFQAEAGASSCSTIAGASYDALTVLPPPTDRPASNHADLNLGLRGYEPVMASRGYVWLDGPTDPLAPHLMELFAEPRIPEIKATYQVYDWDWECNCRAEPLQEPEATAMSVVATTLETVHVPDAGYEIGSGYEVLVLYAEPSRITLKYTRNDNVVAGYTLHIEGICVESGLLNLYDQLDAAGREQLPALRAGQAFARVASDRLTIAIRDTGQFMEPRSYKDWWQ